MVDVIESMAEAGQSGDETAALKVKLLVVRQAQQMDRIGQEPRQTKPAEVACGAIRAANPEFRGEEHRISSVRCLPSVRPDNGSISAGCPGTGYVRNITISSSQNDNLLAGAAAIVLTLGESDIARPNSKSALVRPGQDGSCDFTFLLDHNGQLTLCHVC
jgi:hypothetical protein